MLGAKRFLFAKVSGYLSSGDQISASAEACEFGVGDVGVDGAEAGEGAEATIAASDDALFADYVDKTAQALGDELGVLDKIAGAVDYSRYQHFIFGDFALALLEYAPFVRVPWVGVLK